MPNLKLLRIVLSFCCLASGAISQIPQGHMTGVTELKFKSAINNEDYVLYIKLPVSYISDSTKRYPVLYLTDAQWSFPSAVDIGGGLLYDNLVAEIIYIGIAWPGNFSASRERDFLPVKTDRYPNGGGALKFLEVIKWEIKRMIDSAYRTDKINNGICGGSAGGFFALYTLFHEPTLFNRYIATSPTLEYNDAELFKLEKTFSEKVRLLQADLFLCTGEYEDEMDPFTFKRFTEQLKASNYKGLRIETTVIQKMGHVSSGPYAFGRGLQFVFEKAKIMVDTTLLNKYSGNYEQGTSFSRAGSSLYLHMGTGKIRMHAASNKTFYVPGHHGLLEFEEDGKGSVTGFSVKTSEGKFSGKKLD